MVYVAPRAPDLVRPNGGRLKNRSLELDARRATFVLDAAARASTIDDWSCAATAPAPQVAAFDGAVGDLHDAIGVGNHEIYGDPLPAHLPGGAVQLRVRLAGRRADPAAVHAAAAEGVRGPGGELPHARAIQAAFGRHDVSSIAAHVGGAARDASDALGAVAYASGEDVAFARAPDLFTAAHEAAHVVQQRTGVALAGGVGAAGDTYERHADAVAYEVVCGRSAEALLDAHRSIGGAHAHAGAGGAGAVQRKESAADGGMSKRIGVVTDKKALVRDPPPALTPTSEVIPHDTPVDIVDDAKDAAGARYVRVSAQDGSGTWWTSASNISGATTPGDPAQIDERALASVVAQLVALAPRDYRVHAAEAFDAIVRQCAELRVTSPHQVAYMLATAQHESALGQQTVEEGNRPKAQADGSYSAKNHVKPSKTSSGPDEASATTAYWDDAYGGRGGNAKGTCDGEAYRGQGYAQTTFRDNYAKMSAVLNAQGFSYEADGVRYGGPNPGEQASIAWEPKVDLVKHPDHASKVPSLAARLLVEGAVSGHYTGRKVGQDVNDGAHAQSDYRKARRVINGDKDTLVDPNDASKGDIGDKVASHAKRYEAALVKAWPKVFAAPTQSRP